MWSALSNIGSNSDRGLRGHLSFGHVGLDRRGTRGTRLPSDNQLFRESVINTVQPRLCAPIGTRRLAENRVGA